MRPTEGKVSVFGIDGTAIQWPFCFPRYSTAALSLPAAWAPRTDGAPARVAAAAALCMRVRRVSRIVSIHSSEVIGLPAIVAQRRTVAISPDSDASRLIGLLDDGLAAESLTGDRVFRSCFSKY